MEEPTLHNLASEINVIKRGEADCQVNMERRMKAMEDWKDKASWGIIAILATTLATLATVLIQIIDKH